MQTIAPGGYILRPHKLFKVNYTVYFTNRKSQKGYIDRLAAVNKNDVIKMIDKFYSGTSYIHHVSIDKITSIPVKSFYARSF